VFPGFGRCGAGKRRTRFSMLQTNPRCRTLARQKESKGSAEVDPRVQAITERFAGTVEIIKPE